MTPSLDGGKTKQDGPSASSAAGQASSSSKPGTLRSASTDAGRIYVEAVIDHYLWLPGTPTRPSRHDRRLAKTLYEHGVPLAVVRAALLLGVARRTFRSDPEAPPLPPIRTVHYFLPIIEDVLHHPLETGYVDYLSKKLRPLIEAKASARAAAEPETLRFRPLRRTSRGDGGER